MIEQGQPSMEPPSKWRMFIWKLNHYSWPYTSKIAYLLYKYAHRYEEPFKNQYPRWWWSFMNGLACGCWTHVCGHGPKFSFHMAMIYWNPKPNPKGQMR